LGIASAHPNERLNCPTTDKIGRGTEFTSGPAAMLQRVAPGRCGGLTYATPREARCRKLTLEVVQKYRGQPLEFWV
jgi:hypothetical protein